MWKFNPILKQTIWGGNKIAPYKEIETDKDNVGESWELSGVEGNESVVTDGPDAGLTISQLINRYGASLMGSRNYERFGNRFPLLVKFIDVRDDLSVQVHPDDAMAQKYGEPNGKTEMWFVVEAAPGAKLANGFRNPVNPADYECLLATGEIENVLNFVKIKSGDVYFIPAGRVHAIGKGSFVAEIQQTSDATYRMYDYHRKDKDGKERELHTAKAKEAVNFNDTGGNPVEYTAIENLPVNVVRCPMFTANILALNGKITRNYSENDSFIVLVMTQGRAKVAMEDSMATIHQGETLLLPASTKSVEISPVGECVLLETYI